MGFPPNKDKKLLQPESSSWTHNHLRLTENRCTDETYSTWEVYELSFESFR